MSLHTQLPNGVILAWPTPVFRKVWPGDEAFAAKLSEIILEKERTTPGVQGALIGGWNSDLDLLEWPSPEVAELKDRITEVAREMSQLGLQGKKGKISGSTTITAWANVSRNGHFHRHHTHANSSWSGVYYVATGERDQSRPENGLIKLVDPRLGVEMVPIPGNIFGEKLRFDPEIGMMLVFPSWLQHFVDPYFGEGARISIAFNVLIANLSITEDPADDKSRETLDDSTL